jgi:hypothetical protein
MEKEFQEIGKKMPYSVPEGFFETITEATLENARRRKSSIGKRRLLVQWLAAAALLCGVLYMGIRWLNAPEMGTSQEMAGVPLEIPAPEKIIKSLPEITDLVDSVEVQNSLAIMPEVGNAENAESMEELLASIPDEELLEWGAILHNDPFFEETEENSNHENN